MILLKLVGCADRATNENLSEICYLIFLILDTFQKLALNAMFLIFFLQIFVFDLFNGIT